MSHGGAHSWRRAPKAAASLWASFLPGALSPGVEIKAHTATRAASRALSGLRPRQHQPVCFVEMGQQSPVERLTGAAALAADSFRIQQQAIRRVVEGGQGSPLVTPTAFQIWQPAGSSGRRVSI